MTPLQKAIHQCKLAGACELLRLGMSPTELCQLLRTPQGTEFILKGLPTLSLWRLIGEEYKDLLAQHHIYLDAGYLELDGETTRLIAIGATHLRLPANQPKLYNVTLIHGAKADVLATNWAVVSVERDAQSTAYIACTDNAISI